MLDLMKRALFASVGAVLMTEEKVREMVEELVKKGELSEKEGEGMVREMMQKVEKTRASLEEKVQAQIDKTLDTLNIAPQREVLALKRKIKKLEDDFEALKEELGRKNQSE